jgi:ABC-type glycerol-3-phosphate transport system substrate-binding protein
MSIPIHFPTWGIFWNKALVEKYNIKNVKERIVAGELLDIFREMSSLVRDDDIYVSGTIWNYLCALGVPELEKIEISKFFRERFNRVSKLENVFMLKENSFLESRDLFRDEKVIFYISTNWFISNYTDSFNFPMDILWNIPEIECHCCSSASSIGIYSAQDALEMNIAVKFAEYLLSEGVQKRLVQRNLNCSVLKEGNREILGGQSNPDFERMKCSCDKLSASEFVSSMNSFLMFEIRDLYAKVIKGQIKYMDAARVAEKRWKSFLDENGACYVSD